MTTLCEAPKREADFLSREVYEIYIRNFSRSNFFPEVNPDEAACSCCGHLQKVDKRLSPLCVRNAHPLCSFSLGRNRDESLATYS